MKKRLYILGIALLAGIVSISAQTAGRVINAPYFDLSERILFSQTDFVFGTSRSMAMGGAFTSLGADLSSMNINPAGLGMYQSSDWGITQGLSITSTKAPVGFGGGYSVGGSRVSYGLDNVGAVFNTYNRSSTLTSLSFGFSYNRAANFNSDSHLKTSGNATSIADMFGHQLATLANNEGIGHFDLDSSMRPFENERIWLDEWGAVLGYQTGLLYNNGGDYGVALGEGALADSYTRSLTRGGIYEYSFSAGANISNILYVGATLGTSQIEYNELLTYEENYSNQTGEGLVGEMWYDQNTTISGTGYTMKLGAIVRPVEPLRIGIAFHLPTYYTINKYYTSEMGNNLSRTASSTPLEDIQRFNTAPKLLVGASVVIGQRAILAVDYEHTWYNKIHTRSDDVREVEDSKAESASWLRSASALRAGAEFLINDDISARLGGGYQFNMLKDRLWLPDSPVAHSGFNITAGVGLKIGKNGYVDLSYLFKHSGYTDFENYYLVDGDNSYFQSDNTGGGMTPRTYGSDKELSPYFTHLRK
jgi:hypothetical protein